MILHQEHEKEKERELILSVIDDGEEVRLQLCLAVAISTYEFVCLQYCSGPGWIGCLVLSAPMHGVRSRN